MRLSKALQEKQMDVRLRDKLAAEGKLTKEDIDKFLSTLPDEKDNFLLTQGEREGLSSSNRPQ